MLEESYGCELKCKWVDHKCEGKVDLKCDNGKSYIGEWKNNMKHGKGLLT